MGDHDGGDEVYLGDEQGGIDGVVVADLEGQGGDEDEMDEDTGSIDDHKGGETMDDVQDDSIHSFEGHKGSVFGVAWSRKGDGIVCSGGEDDLAACWKVATDVNNVENLETSWLRGHADSVILASYSGDGELLATAGMDGAVKIWKHPGYELLNTLDGPGEAIEWVDWHPKGNIVLAGSADFTSWMWNAQTGVCMQVFTGHNSPVACGGFTPDGKLVVCGGGGDSDASLKIFDPKNGVCLHSIEGHGFHESGLTCIDFLSDSSITVTGSSDGTGKIANLSTGKAVGTLQGHTDSVECCCFVEDFLPLILTGSLDGDVLVWDQGSLAKRQRLTHPQGITVMKTVPSSSLLATGSMDGEVRVWDIRSNDCVKEFHGFRASVLCLDISPDSKYIIAGSDDSTVKAFEL